jgi:hypothetical protein
VRAVAAEALLPVAGALAAGPPQERAALVAALWDLLLDLDELSPSTGVLSNHDTRFFLLGQGMYGAVGAWHGPPQHYDCHTPMPTISSTAQAAARVQAALWVASEPSALSTGAPLLLRTSRRHVQRSWRTSRLPSPGQSTVLSRATPSASASPRRGRQAGAFTRQAGGAQAARCSS